MPNKRHSGTSVVNDESGWTRTTVIKRRERKMIKKKEKDAVFAEKKSKGKYIKK